MTPLSGADSCWLTIDEATALLHQRGIFTDTRTVQRWCAAGLFAGAYKDLTTGRRGTWRLPRESVATMVPLHVDGAARPREEWHRRRQDDRNAEVTTALAHAYRQPWAPTFFGALRDHHPAPHVVAGVAEHTVMEEAYENPLFVGHGRTLLGRRYTFVSASLEGEELVPHPIWTWQQIEQAINGDRRLPPHRRIHRRERGIFEQAMEHGSLCTTERVSTSVRNLWWRYCELYNLPVIVQVPGHSRYYTALEIDLACVWEADGPPRVFDARAMDRLNTSFYRLYQYRQHVHPWLEHTNPRYVGSFYLVRTTTDVAGELLTIYRQSFPTDPPPNPEQSPAWNAAQIRRQPVPKQWMFRGSRVTA